MWLDDLEPGESWMGVWKGKFLCFNCGAIIEENPCAVCSYLHKPFIIPGLPEKDQPKTLTFQGAIHENTYITLGLLKREWQRPLIPESEVTDLLGRKIPQRFIILDLIRKPYGPLVYQEAGQHSTKACQKPVKEK